MPRVRIGCSGWHYRDWRGRFYPPGMPKSQWLERYSSHFDCVEVNNSFYRLPEASTLARWRDIVPSRFLFAVKASRYLTHILRLRDPGAPLQRLLDRVVELDGTLGPLLYQLPPRWMPDEQRLEEFLEALPRTVEIAGHRRRLHHVVEFRDPRGYEPAVLRRLERHGVAVCMHDMAGSESPRVVTGPIAYVRFHGYHARYGGSYPPRVLRDWATWLRRLSRTTTTFVFFNNDVQGHAVTNATALRALLER